MVLSLALTVACHSVAVEPTVNSEASRIWIPKSAGVYWWAGIIDHGFQMPLTNGYEADLLGETYGNQGQPLLLSSQGDVIWSEDPLRIKASEEVCWSRPTAPDCGEASPAVLCARPSYMRGRVLSRLREDAR